MWPHGPPPPPPKLGSLDWFLDLLYGLFDRVLSLDTWSVLLACGAFVACLMLVVALTAEEDGDIPPEF